MSDIRMKAWHIQNLIEVEDDIQVVPLSCASEFINKLKSDQCKFCVVRGDIEKCKATDCSIHENWYSLEQKKSIESLEKRVKELEADNKRKAKVLVDVRNLIERHDIDVFGSNTDGKLEWPLSAEVIDDITKAL
jgi:hypothetical protein